MAWARSIEPHASAAVLVLDIIEDYHRVRAHTRVTMHRHNIGCLRSHASVLDYVRPHANTWKRYRRVRLGQSVASTEASDMTLRGP